jgi:hypothetical protein
MQVFKKTLQMKYTNFLFLLCLIFTSCDIKKPVEPEADEEVISQDHPNFFVGQHKTKVAILGVFHFRNPGLDSYKPKFSVDVLSEKRQAEIDDLLNSISEFRPTKILLEVSRKRADSLLNDRYRQYLSGEYDISDQANEIYQLGFRLAEKLGHKRLYAVDEKNSDWFGAEIDWDAYDSEEYRKSLNQYAKSTRYEYGPIYEMDDSLKTVTSLKEYFKYMNNPNRRLKRHQAYLTSTVLTGAGDKYIGADLVARWYQRNLKIFANTYDLADFSKEDRILMIYGAGHVWQLRQLLSDSPDFEYVEINEFL